MVLAFGVFTFTFFGYVAFRSYNAEIGGTEQPMDLMYLNATLNSEEYPPKDPWLSGEPASYYYFGYVQSGLLTSVADVPASSGYNLSLAYTFAAAAAGVSSVAYALARWMLGSKRRNWALAGGGGVDVLLFGSLSRVRLAAAHALHRDLYAGVPLHVRASGRRDCGSPTPDGVTPGLVLVGRQQIVRGKPDSVL